MARTRKSEALFNEARATEDALRAALGRLSGRLTGRRDARDATDDLLGLVTGPLGQTVLATSAARALRAYPVATVLVGAGLAWLTFGAPRREESLTDRVADTLEDWQARADDARDTARDRLAALYDKMSERGHDAAAFAREKATVTADLASDLAAAFSHGLSDLSEDASERIIAARERAYSAFASGAETVEDKVDDLMDDADDRNFLRRHPVASAAVAVALGAALATALQANRRDGETLADSAENLMAKARKTFDAETSAAGRAIGEAASVLRARGTEAALAMVSDLTDILEGARSKGRDAVDTVEDAVDDVEDVVRKTARRTSEKVNGAAKRVSAQTRQRRKATQKLADKLTGGRAH